ncbi:MAG: hypothetical protein ACRD5R_18225 [Candidatus Acidiferrales bacterium]
MSMETRRPHDTSSDEPRYEKRDVNLGALSKWGLALAITIIVVMFAMKWLFVFYGNIQPLGEDASPIENARVLPSGPRLQANPRADNVSYCGEQTEMLQTYGWVNQAAGQVRVPVDRAMALILERGLPTRTPAEVSAAAAASELPASATAVPSTQDMTGQCGYVANWTDEPKP